MFVPHPRYSSAKSLYQDRWGNPVSLNQVIVGDPLPDGGTAGQVLKRTGNGSGLAWGDDGGGSGGGGTTVTLEPDPEYPWVGILYVDDGVTTGTAPTVTTTTLNTMTSGVPVNQQLQATGTLPINWAVTAGSLPTGLNLSSTGLLSGTYGAGTSGTPYSFTVTASNAFGSDDQPYSGTIGVAAQWPGQAFTASATEGVAYTSNISVTGSSPFTYTIVSGALPPGLTLQTGAFPNQARLSGTPTTAGEYNFTARVENIYGFDEQAYTVSVVSATPFAPRIIQPPAGFLIPSGGTATMAVAVIGSPAPTYQWQDGGEFGTSFSNIPGATSATYTTPALTNSRVYRCVVSNSQGTITTTQAAVSIQASAVIPGFISHPQDASTVAGQTARIGGSTQTSGRSASTQWQTRPDSGGTWVNVTGGTVYADGSTNPEYLTPALTSGDNGRQYRLAVTNSAGTSYTNPATVTVAAAVAPTYTAKYPAENGWAQYTRENDSLAAGGAINLVLIPSDNPDVKSGDFSAEFKVGTGEWLAMGAYRDYYAQQTEAGALVIRCVLPTNVPDTSTPFEARFTITTSAGTTTFDTGQVFLTGAPA